MSTLSLQSRIDQLDTFVVESARDVCSTMLNWSVTTSDPVSMTSPVSFELGTINGSIGFGGKLTGSIFLSCDEKTAQMMARAIMGHDAGATEVSDVIAELTNMLAGGCKSRLCDHDCTVVMSIPNIIRGKAIRAASRDVKFMLKRDFGVSISGETFQVIILGKFE